MIQNTSSLHRREENLPPLIGHAPAFQTLLAQVSALAPVSRPVIVIGERGTGKELIAARLHYLSPRWNQTFVRLNCAALNENLLDTELFGHEAGAFTGAARQRAGRFEIADGGSLFLDEIATASMAVQEKMLRVIEYGSFERLGSSTPLSVNVRLICATHANLPAMANAGTFRADLLDRLSFAVITLPPLRERKEDIPLLATHFAIAMTQELGRSVFPGFSQVAEKVLLEHPWPGNVRELKNVVERAVALEEDPSRPLTHIELNPFTTPCPPLSPVPSSSDTRFENRIADFEKTLLREALQESHFNQTKAAQRLGLGYHQLRRLLRKHHLS